LIEDRFDKKLSSWLGKLLSDGDRLILINSILTSLPMFILSFFEIPKGVRKRLDFFRSRFFWQSDSHKKKYRLTKWNLICRPKDHGGLGIEVLELKNKCLLRKWPFKLINENGVWQQILHNKYLHSKTLSQVTSKPTELPFWKGLMRVKEDFFTRGSFILGDGSSIRLWEDTWLGVSPLATKYPSLYNVPRHKDQTVAHTFASVPLNIEFRRSLVGARWNRWLHLLHRLSDVQLEPHDDEFRWRLT
jgi:hypothetical protein